MIVSALLTSVGINFGLCVLFLTLYSILRKQPGKYHIYVPRKLADGKAERRSCFDIARLIPTPGWVKRAWQLSEQDLLESSGLDAVVFMHIISFSLKIFSVAGVIGIFILIPVNCSGNQLAIIDFANVTGDSLDVFSISNVKNGSNKLWIHFSAVVFSLSLSVTFFIMNTDIYPR